MLLSCPERHDSLTVTDIPRHRCSSLTSAVTLTQIPGETFIRLSQSLRALRASSALSTFISSRLSSSVCFIFHHHFENKRHFEAVTSCRAGIDYIHKKGVEFKQCIYPTRQSTTGMRKTSTQPSMATAVCNVTRVDSFARRVRATHCAAASLAFGTSHNQWPQHRVLDVQFQVKAHKKKKNTHTVDKQETKKRGSENYSSVQPDGWNRPVSLSWNHKARL